MKQVEESLPRPLQGLTLPDKEARDTLILNGTDPGQAPQQELARAGQAHAPTDSSGHRPDRTSSDRLLRTVVENAPIIIFTLDHAGIFTMAEGQGM
ncbi:MAG: hypothetical protein WCD86_07705, partial [Ktedonobacteraceae bacterium]